MLDNSTNIDYTFYDGSNNIPDDSVQAVLTDLATVLAKSLYYVITKNDYKGPDYLKSTFVSIILVVIDCIFCNTVKNLSANYLCTFAICCEVFLSFFIFK